MTTHHTEITIAAIFGLLTGAALVYYGLPHLPFVIDQLTIGLSEIIVNYPKVECINIPPTP